LISRNQATDGSVVVIPSNRQWAKGLAANRPRRTRSFSASRLHHLTGWIRILHRRAWS